MVLSMDQVDPTFAGVYQALFGNAIDVREAYEISKFAPQGSDVSTHSNPKREKKLAAVGMAGAGLAGVAGSHGLYLSTKKYGKDLHPKNFRKPPTPAQGVLPGMEKLGAVAESSPKKKALVGASLIGLHAAELGADALGARALHRQYKKAKADEVKKALDEIVQARRMGMLTTDAAIEKAAEVVEEISKWDPLGIARATKNAITTTSVFAKPPTARVASGAQRAKRLIPAVRAQNQQMVNNAAPQMIKEGRKMALRTTAIGAGGAAGILAYRHGKKKGLQAQVEPVVKSDDRVDYGFTGEISKRDDEHRNVFGWCSLSTIDGQPVVDLQNDYAPIDEIEKSAYAYVTTSRVGGDMHAREGERPRHTSDLIESFIATPEKLEQMGIPAEISKSVPVGWWVGFHVNDDEQWEMVKDGRRAGFSIHGAGSRLSKVLDA